VGDAWSGERSFIVSRMKCTHAATRILGVLLLGFAAGLACESSSASAPNDACSTLGECCLKLPVAEQSGCLALLQTGASSICAAALLTLSCGAPTSGSGTGIGTGTGLGTGTGTGIGTNTGSSNSTGTGMGSGTVGAGTCSPCTSDSDCLPNARCVYYGDDSNPYNCSPICPADHVCPAGLICGGDGEDIDAGKYYDVCFPSSNTCLGWDGGS